MGEVFLGLLMMMLAFCMGYYAGLTRVADIEEHEEIFSKTDDGKYYSTDKTIQMMSVDEKAGD